MATDRDTEGRWVLRWAGPALCLMLACFAFAGLHLSSTGPVWVLVGIDRIVGPDPEVQAAWTWRLLAVVGLGWGVLAWWLGDRRADAGADA